MPPVQNPLSTMPKPGSQESLGFIKPQGLLEPEFAPHYSAWKADPSPENTGQLLKTLNPVVESAMRTYAGGSATSPTLRSKAKLIVLSALPRYDSSKAKLRTHLMFNLQSLHRQTAKEQQIISVPERVGLDLHKLYLAEEELKDRLGRDPSDMELSKQTGLSPRRITHVRRARLGVAEGSVIARAAEEDRPLAAPAVVQQDNDTWLRFIYLDLDPTDQVIMEHTIGLHNKPVLKKSDIARKLGISPGAVSQRSARIQRLIDSRETLAQSLM